MSDYKNKYLDSNGVKFLWDKAKGLYVKQEEGKGLSEENYSREEKEKLATLVNYELPNASADSLGGIKIGAGLEIDEDGVAHTVYNPEMPVEWDVIEDKPTTIEGYGITDAATKEELEEVKEEVSKVYHPRGSVATYADLLAIENPHEGDVYDVLENDKNYAWVQKNGSWVWDDIGGTIEIEALSDYDLDIITGSASTPEALIELLAEGGDVCLSANIALNNPVVIDKNTVLDLGGYKITSSTQGCLLSASGASLVLKNGSIATSKYIAQAINGGELVIESGTYTSGDVGFCARGEGSKLFFIGGNLTAQDGGIGAFENAFVQIDGGTVIGIDNFPLFTNGTEGKGGNTIIFNDGELVGNIVTAGYEACGVYIANNDSFTMNGGSIKVNGGCGILMRGGTVVINDGRVEVTTGPNVPGWVGDNKTKMNASAVIYHESANYPGKAGMSLTINDGVFVGVDHSVEILSNETTPDVTINGGKFTPVFPEE